MLLCLDVGNSQIFGGVFHQDTLKLHFRHDSKQASTSDQLGIFLRMALRENNIDPLAISQIAICSVVPSIDYSVRAACLKYFNIEPYVLNPQTTTALTIKYRNPAEVGADRIATAIAACQQFTDKNLIVVDLGTATTLDVITRDKAYLGGAILPGMRLSMDALQSKTAKLSAVTILKPDNAVGKATIESLQSGLYYGQLGMIRELSQVMSKEAFGNEPYLLIGTGGFAHLFENEKLFDAIVPELVLDGLRYSVSN